MSINSKITYWLDVAHYDLVSAKAMLQAKRYLYVGFLCHQTIEKCLKAYYWKAQENEPPYTHNLLLLADKSEFEKEYYKQYHEFFNELMPLNIQARYPEDKELLLKSLNAKKCKTLYAKTEGFYKWIKKLLK
jgi:HEPN domain-containing protein